MSNKRKRKGVDFFAFRGRRPYTLELGGRVCRERRRRPNGSGDDRGEKSGTRVIADRLEKLEAGVRIIINK